MQQLWRSYQEPKICIDYSSPNETQKIAATIAPQADRESKMVGVAYEAMWIMQPTQHLYSPNRIDDFCYFLSFTNI